MARTSVSRPRLARAVAAVTAAASLAACGTTTNSSNGSSSKAPIPVASLLDETGPLNGYGLPMQAATKMAIEDINAKGGVLGRPLRLIDRDAQSDIAHYTVEAKSLAMDGEVAVVQGGITSASREAIRPVFDAARKLYFYNVLYEGGVCDKNTFVTGETPMQQLQPLLKWAAKNGHKRWYVLAANYNYGQISAQWVKKLAAQYGATIVGGPTFFDLTVNNFTDQIGNIQGSGADTIVSLLVGPAHMNFYKQWAATGLNKSTVIVSPSFGLGEEQVALGAAGKGIYSAFSYFQDLDTPTSKAFVAKWRATGTRDAVTPAAVSTWVAWHLWADAANKAGSLDRSKVIAQLERSTAYDGPQGAVRMDPGSHHLLMPMRLWQANGAGGFIKIADLAAEAAPSFEQSKCDLVRNPSTNRQFTP